MTAFAPPTEDVQKLVDLLGEAAALCLVEARGGTRIYIADYAAAPDPEGELAKLVGLDGAVAMYERYGRGWHRVPVARPWRVLCYLAQGMNRTQAALKAVCHENTVDDIVRRYGRPRGNQLDLFDKAG
jgi:hypothetical protein